MTPNSGSTIIDDFQSLLARAREGDKSAQETICNRYEQQVLIAARVLLGPLIRPHLESIDIVQSVHRSLLVGLRDQRYDIASPEKLIGLACTIARRKVARKWRSYRRQSRLFDNQRGESLVTVLTNLARPSEQTPYDEAAYQDQISHILSCLAPIEKSMLELRLAGYTMQETAEHIGLNTIAVRVRWSRLRARLKTAGIDSDLL